MLTIERLRQRLHYDPTSGHFTWLENAGIRVLKGLRAGTTKKNGYRSIWFDGKQYLAHRLAFFYMTGAWPDKYVDHKNVTPGDDRWENLRPATKVQNAGNTGLMVTNTSGFRGVSWSKQRGKWRAQIVVDRRHRVLGYFDDKKSASDVYVAAAQIHFGEFARTA